MILQKHSSWNIGNYQMWLSHLLFPDHCLPSPICLSLTPQKLNGMEAEKDNFRAGDPQWEFAVKVPRWRSAVRVRSEGSAVKVPQRRLRSENLRTENFNRYLTLNNAHFHHDLNHASMSKYCPSIVYQMRSLRGLDKAVMWWMISNTLSVVLKRLNCDILMKLFHTWRPYRR